MQSKEPKLIYVQKSENNNYINIKIHSTQLGILFILHIPAIYHMNKNYIFHSKRHGIQANETNETFYTVRRSSLISSSVPVFSVESLFTEPALSSPALFEFLLLSACLLNQPLAEIPQSLGQALLSRQKARLHLIAVNKVLTRHAFHARMQCNIACCRSSLQQCIRFDVNKVKRL